MKIQMRKLVAGLSALAILLATAPQVFAVDTAPFPDVSVNHPQSDEISFMKENGVFTGYPDGTFQPNTVLNRAEQLKVYMLIHNMNPSAVDYKNCFPDVKEEWFARYVCFAKEQGWVEGYPDGTFKPAQQVNKVEALKMLGEIQGWDMTEPTVAPYSDTPVGQWYSKYVAFAKNVGLEDENVAGFDPSAGLTRAMTARLLFRSLVVYTNLNGATKYTDDLDDEIMLIDVKNDIQPPVQINMGVAPVAEYGDAPENGPAGYAGSYSTVQANFPSTFANDGARLMDSSMEWLGDASIGDSASIEEDAIDSNDPDSIQNLDNQDGFDDGVRGLNISLVSIPPPATLTVDVSVATNAPATTRYLNVLIDLDMDGEWGGKAGLGEPEWVVKNMPITVAPGTTKTITTDPFAYSNGWLLTPTTWMRTMVSREMVTDVDWDGTGEYSFGEVEDYYVQLPKWSTGGGGTGGGAGGRGAGGRGLVWGKPAPVMVCPQKMHFPKDVFVISFSCGIYNYGGRGDVKYTLTRQTGGVDVLPTTGVLTMPTAPPGFPPFGVVGNPAIERFLAFKGATPSTWLYTIVGVDPPSSVDENGNVDLGLVPGDSDEGYTSEAGNGGFDLVTSWAEEIDEAYLIPENYERPIILDAIFMGINDVDPGEYHFKIKADVRHPEANTDMVYQWESLVGGNCGEFVQESQYSNMVDWYFSEGDALNCMNGGVELRVSDGENMESMEFEGMFKDYPLDGLNGNSSNNSAPVVETVFAEWLNMLADDPHEYELTVFADDSDQDSLSYDWKEVSCGWFDGATNNQSVTWMYDLADMEECGSAEVTVEVSDGQEVVEYTQSIFQ